MPLLFSVFGALIGAGCASAIQCFVERREEGRPWTHGRSLCDSCGKRLGVMALLPILGYVAGAGRSRCCKRPIGSRYLVLELVGALGGAYVGFMLGDPLEALFAACLVLYGLYVISLDVRSRQIDLLTATGAAVIFLAFAWPWSLAGVGMSLSIGIGFFLLQYVLSRGTAIGGGDVWIGLVLGAAFPGYMVLPVIGLGYIVGAIHALELLVRKRAVKGMHLPLGAYLMIGAVLMLWLEPYVAALFGIL